MPFHGAIMEPALDGATALDSCEAGVPNVIVSEGIFFCMQVTAKVILLQLCLTDPPSLRCCRKIRSAKAMLHCVK